MKFELVKDNYCSYCGSELPEAYPKECVCKNITYKNPIPVVVGVLSTDKGILIIKRNTEPKKHTWNFISGYIDLGETYQESVVREIKEEVGLDCQIENVSLIDVNMSADLKTILIFTKITTEIPKDYKFVPNKEVQEIKFINTPEKLGFKTHQDCLADLLWSVIDFESFDYVVWFKDLIGTEDYIDNLKKTSDGFEYSFKTDNVSMDIFYKFPKYIDNLLIRIEKSNDVSKQTYLLGLKDSREIKNFLKEIENFVKGNK